MPQKLTRKEFADELRAEYPDAASLTDDELVEIGIEDDPDLGNYVESSQEQFSRETRTIGTSMGAPEPPSLDPARPAIPSPQDALIRGTEKNLGPVAKTALKYARPVLGGIQEGLTGGLSGGENIHSEDSPTARVAGNVIGGGGVMLGAAAAGGLPAMIAAGGAQGAFM